MRQKREFAMNKLFNLLMVSGLFFAYLSAECFAEGDTPWAIVFGVVALLLVCCSLMFTPFCYAFDSEGVSLCYVLLPNERYLWENIHAIEVKNISTGNKSTLFELFYAFVFCIKGKTVGESRFYMEGHIRKSFRTKRLLEKYWDGTITGYWFEDIKKRRNKRKTKKQAQIKAHLTDEVVPMEREIRAKVREWINPFVAQANQYGLDMRAEYVYITEDFEDRRSRPKEGYTYTLVVEISRFNERDEERILVFSTDLLYVRLGKTAYRGVINEHAKEEIQVTLSDALGQISREGIESYTKNQA